MGRGNEMAGTEKVDMHGQGFGSLGKYRLEKKLGEGGFGAVYKAFDPDLQVYRAIKVPTVQGEKAQEQLKEARIQVQINHPNIVQVHSVDQLDGKWAIVMEYVEGGSLRDRVGPQKPLPIDDALRYTIGIASGLKEAHDKNILHHDIKPENILFDSKGVPKVADFGIARIVQESGQDMSRVMGTVSYMAPEQLEGMADLRSDIWSLGVMLYEMLSGKDCFAGKSQPEVVKKIAMGSPVSLHKVNPAVPREVDAVVMRMIEKDPSERYQNMDEVIRDIEAYREGVWVRKRKPLRVIVPMMVALVFIVAGGVYGVHAGIFDGFDLLFHTQEQPDMPVTDIPPDVLALGYAEQIKAADNVTDEGKYYLAHEILSNVIDKAQDPAIRSQALFSRGFLLSQNINFPDFALRDYETLIRENPGSALAANAHYYAGWVYYEKKNNLKKAVLHLTTVINEYPDSPMNATAQFLAQDAAVRLAKEGEDVGLVAKSVLGGFLPNNITSLIVSLISFITFISMPLAWILTQYHRPQIDAEGGVATTHLFKAIMKTPGLKFLMIVIILSQIVSFLITNFESKEDYTDMIQALKNSGVVVQVEIK